MSLTDKDKEIAYRIVTHLQEQVKSKKLDEEQSEGVSVAVQCICAAYGLEMGVEDEKKYADSKTLGEMFGVLPMLSDEDKAKSEEIKQKGNVQLKSNNFQEAISLYSQAIEIDPSNATFFCNRAAAYIKVEDYQKALTDCEKAVEIDPGYSRAHGRMGYIYSVLKKHEEAKKCFEKAIQLDPANESYKGNLDALQEQLKASNPPQGGGANPGMGAGLGGLLGGGGLAGLLQNPGFMNMATTMMQNPAFQNVAGRLMQQGPPNPQNMAEVMPDVVDAARQMQQENPELFESLRQQTAQFVPEEEAPQPDSAKDSKS